MLNRLGRGTVSPRRMLLHNASLGGRLPAAGAFDPALIAVVYRRLMEDLTLSDRLRLIGFEVMLQRLPTWMLGALYDAAARLEDRRPDGWCESTRTGAGGPVAQADRRARPLGGS